MGINMNFLKLGNYGFKQEHNIGENAIYLEFLRT